MRLNVAIFLNLTRVLHGADGFKDILTVLSPGLLDLCKGHAAGQCSLTIDQLSQGGIQHHRVHSLAKSGRIGFAAQLYLKHTVLCFCIKNIFRLEIAAKISSRREQGRLIGLSLLSDHGSQDSRLRSSSFQLSLGGNRIRRNALHRIGNNFIQFGNNVLNDGGNRRIRQLCHRTIDIHIHFLGSQLNVGRLGPVITGNQVDVIPLSTDNDIGNLVAFLSLQGDILFGKIGFFQKLIQYVGFLNRLCKSAHHCESHHNDQ